MPLDLFIVTLTILCPHTPCKIHINIICPHKPRLSLYVFRNNFVCSAHPSVRDKFPALVFNSSTLIAIIINRDGYIRHRNQPTGWTVRVQGFDSLQKQTFLYSSASRLTPGPRKPPFQRVPEALFLPYSGRSLKVTTHLAPVPRLETSGAVSLLPIHLNGKVLNSNSTNLCAICWSGLMKEASDSSLRVHAFHRNSLFNTRLYFHVRYTACTEC